MKTVKTNDSENNYYWDKARAAHMGGVGGTVYDTENLLRMNEGSDSPQTTLSAKTTLSKLMAMR